MMLGPVEYRSIPGHDRVSYEDVVGDKAVDVIASTTLSGERVAPLVEPRRPNVLFSSVGSRVIPSNVSIEWDCSMSMFDGSDIVKGDKMYLGIFDFPAAKFVKTFQFSRLVSGGFVEKSS